MNQKNAPLYDVKDCVLALSVIMALSLRRS